RGSQPLGPSNFITESLRSGDMPDRPSRTRVYLAVAAILAGGLVYGKATASSDAGDVTPLEPTRLLDTRPGGATVDGAMRELGLQPAGATLALRVIDRGGVPDTASAVVLNLTAVEAH